MEANLYAWGGGGGGDGGSGVGAVPQHIAPYSLRPAAQSIVASPPFSQSSASWHVYSVPSCTPALVMALKGLPFVILQIVHGADALPLLATQRMRSCSPIVSSSPAGFHNTAPPDAQSCALHLAWPGYSPTWNSLPPRPSASAAALHSTSVAATAKPAGQEVEANWYVWGGGGGGDGGSRVGAVPQHIAPHSMWPAAQSIVASPPFSQSSASWHVYSV